LPRFTTRLGETMEQFEDKPTITTEQDPL